METVTCASTLDALLDPASIALVGASEDQSKFGGRLFRMLLKHGYGGKVLPVNPSRSSLFGLPAVPDLAALDSVPDLAVFTVGARYRAGAGADCGSNGGTRFAGDLCGLC